ncbi:MAG: hypothetical protein AB1489_35650, partial [Acidobacteriota bacterium]
INELSIAKHHNLILRALRGENLTTFPRYPDNFSNNETSLQINKAALAHEMEFENRFEQWLKERGKNSKQ